MKNRKESIEIIEDLVTKNIFIQFELSINLIVKYLSYIDQFFIDILATLQRKFLDLKSRKYTPPWRNSPNPDTNSLGRDINFLYLNKVR